MKLFAKNNDIFSMSLIKYNANTGGSNVGDCVCRAISMAFNINYNEVRRYLNKYKKELNTFSYKTIDVFSKLIKELGGSAPINVKEEITVEQFVDSHDDNNAYILEVGKTRDRSSHLVACRNDNLFDSWDCSKWFVVNYFIVPPSCFGEDLELSDIKDYLKQFATKDIPHVIEQYFYQLDNKWFTKYNNHYDFEWLSYKIQDYLVEHQMRFSFRLSDGTTKYWVFKIAYAFTPYMDYDQAVKLIDEKTKGRLYDKFYEIHKYIDEYEEEYANISKEDIPQTEIYEYGSRSESRKFLHTLPAWVQLRCKSILVKSARGNQYRDEDNYRIVCKPLPNDEDKEDVLFYGPTADCIREEIELYKDDFLRADKNYGVDYDGIYDY